MRNKSIPKIHDITPLFKNLLLLLLNLIITYLQIMFFPSPKKKKKKKQLMDHIQIINCKKWHFNSGRTAQPICPHIIYARDSFNPKSERLGSQRPTHQPGIGQFSRVQISKRVMISLQSERTSIQVSTELIYCPHDSHAFFFYRSILFRSSC